MDMPIPLDHRVDPTSDPTSKLDIIYKCNLWPASSLAEPPPAASPQLGRWICQQGVRSARMRCLLLLVLAAAKVLLLLCCCCCCLLLLLLLLLLLAAAAASMTAALLFAFLRLATFRTGMIILELATTTTTTTTTLLYLSPPVLLLLLAASTTTALPCLFTFGHFSYWYDRNITAAVTASVGTGFASHCCMPCYE